jgi:hypothetical protein
VGVDPVGANPWQQPLGAVFAPFPVPRRWCARPAAIVKSQGIDGLIAALNRKADILTAQS